MSVLGLLHSANGAPFDQSVIDAGVDVWRNQIDTRGRACADCHGSPDAFDLAFFNFTDSDIRRRGTPNHIGTVDTEKVVELVRELRKKHDITAPKDPRTTRVFQPGGEPLPGATATERDAAFLQTLQTKLPMLANGTIDSTAKAETAIAELLNYDMRTEPNGILFPLWSEDILFGNDHGSITDWIADEGYIPTNAAARTTINNARDTYTANPTEANFWAMYRAVSANADVRSTVTHSNQRALWEDKFLNSLIGSHDLRMTQLNLPRIMDKANTRHTQINGSAYAFPTWMIGDNVNDVGTFSSEIRESLKSGISDENHVAKGKDAWWWVGFMYNNSFEHEPERQEYFPNSLASNTPARRTDQGSGYFTAHALFTRAKSDFSAARLNHPITGVPGKYGNTRNNPVAPFSTAPIIGISLPVNPDAEPNRWFNAAHKEQYKKIAINISKMRLYAIKKQFEENIAGGKNGFTLGFNERGDWNDLLNTRFQLAKWDSANSSHNEALVTTVENLRRQARHGVTTPIHGNGTGLNGAYFNSLDFTNPVASRIDPKVDFVSGAKYFGGADAAIYPTASGNLSVRWTGFFTPKFTDTYSFWMFMSGDDMEFPLAYPQPNQGASKVWVNHVLVFDMWTTGNRGLEPNPLIYFPTVALVAGRTYPITVEYKQTGAYQRASLWQNSAKQIWEPVAQTQLHAVQPPPAVPPAPNNLLFSALTGNSVRVSWTDYSFDETQFVIQRKTGPSGAWVDVSTVAANVVSWDNPGLAPTTQYSYRVRATNAQGDSLYSTEAAITTTAGPDIERVESVTEANLAIADLTAIGTTDWVNLGKNTTTTPATIVNRKSGGTGITQVTSTSYKGGGSLGGISFNYTNGSPTPVATGTTQGAMIKLEGGPRVFTVTFDISNKTGYVHLWHSCQQATTGTLTATQTGKPSVSKTLAAGYSERKSAHDRIFFKGEPGDTLTVTNSGSGDYSGRIGLDAVALAAVQNTVSSFADWAATTKGLNGPAAAFDADPDKDGLQNGIEFILGGEPSPANPNSHSASLLPTAQTTADNLIFTFTRTDVSAYLNPTVEFSESLTGSWTTAVHGTNASIAVIDGSPADTVTVTIPRNGASKFFARLKAVQPTP